MYKDLPNINLELTNTEAKVDGSRIVLVMSGVTKKQKNFQHVHFHMDPSMMGYVGEELHKAHAKLQARLNELQRMLKGER